VGRKLPGIISWHGGSATLVNRERERRAFHQGSYWDLKATLQQEKTPFAAGLVKWEELAGYW